MKYNIKCMCIYIYYMCNNHSIHNSLSCIYIYMNIVYNDILYIYYTYYYHIISTIIIVLTIIIVITIVIIVTIVITSTIVIILITMIITVIISYHLCFSLIIYACSYNPPSKLCVEKQKTPSHPIPGTLRARRAFGKAPVP